MKEIYKWVHLYQVDGKIEEIEQTSTNKALLEMLETSGDVIDMGTKRIFVPPECPFEDGKLLRAEIRDERDELVDVKLFCPKCKTILDREEV